MLTESRLFYGKHVTSIFYYHIVQVFLYLKAVADLFFFFLSAFTFFLIFRLACCLRCSFICVNVKVILVSNPALLLDCI